MEFVRDLSKTELEDIHIIRRETAERVLTPERERLLETIATAESSSMRDLARRVDRNVSVVSRDLDILFEADIIDYEQNGRSKKPVLAHENVIVEPIVYNGSVTPRGE
ncbi:HVO_A0114 family putative DNA-binding protein [Natrialba aegyptia]|uniref:Transcriptional regulator n=1 Tax=Natrialba aegyptia DSM 13077 TaxID=1227491 RepID=M0B4G9_9EURY|nr:hypothetical protein [Natrialba aegyptia]ELZ05720.1 hypothetical protein C480_09995 [Natrialba aegyptia DSM 13077]